MHVLTLAPGLPIRVLDQILTVTEQSLTQAGATRIWAERSTSGTVDGRATSRIEQGRCPTPQSR